MAEWFKAEDCKSFFRRFESGPGLRSSCSSVGQSSCFVLSRPGVRIPPRAHKNERMAHVHLYTEKDPILDQNPHLRHMAPFRDLISDVGESRANEIVLAIFYIYDPGSKMADSGMSKAEVINDVNVSILNDPSFDWDPYAELVDFYKSNCFGKSGSLLKTMEGQLESLKKVLDEDEDWSLDNAAKKASLMKTYSEMFNQYMDVKERVEEERAQDEMSYGGYNKSPLEKLANESGQ